TLVNISNLSVQFAVIGTLAIGTTAIIICREIDLSIGAVEGFCAVVAAIVSVKWEIPWPLAVLAAIVAGSLIGGLNGWLVTRIGIPSFVATPGGLCIVSGGGPVINGRGNNYGLPHAHQMIRPGAPGCVRAPLPIRP